MSGYLDELETQLAALTKASGRSSAPVARSQARVVSRAAFVVLTTCVGLSIPLAALHFALDHHGRARHAASAVGSQPNEANPIFDYLSIARRPQRPSDVRQVVGLSLGTCPVRRVAPKRSQNPLLARGPTVQIACAGGTDVQLRYGLQNPSQALIRRADLHGTGLRVWLIVGRRGACWDAVGPQPEHVVGERCFLGSELRKRLLVATLPVARGTRSEVGLLTDRVSALSLRTATSTKLVRVVDGFFFVSPSAGDELLAQTGPSVKVIQRF